MDGWSCCWTEIQKFKALILHQWVWPWKQQMHEVIHAFIILDLSSGAASDCSLIVYFKLYQVISYVKTTGSHAGSKGIIS